MNTHTNNDEEDDSKRCNVFIIYNYSDSFRKQAEERYDLHESQRQQYSSCDEGLFNRQEASDQKNNDNETIINAYLNDLCMDIIVDSYDVEAVHNSSSYTANKDVTTAITIVHNKEDTKVIEDLSRSRSSTSLSSSVDVTHSVLNSGRANFFNVKRVLPSTFEDHELSPKKQASSSIKEKDHELPPNDYFERVTADLDSTLLVFQKVCSINQKQGQKIQWPAIIKLLERSVNTDEGNIENGVSWITFKRSLKTRFDRLSKSASIKFMKKKPPQMFASLLKKEKYESGALLIYGQTGSHSMIKEKKKDTNVICFVNAGILHGNFIRSDSSCDTDILGLEDFDFQHTNIVFPIVLKESSFFSKIHTIKLVNVSRFKNKS
jgi:hypothetical protein